MGRAKEEWMRREENEPMYEWIEENYGEDAGEEGSEIWNEAVKAFEEHCEEQQRLEEEAYWQDEYDYYIFLTLKDADIIFTKDLSELRSMLTTNSAMSANHTYLKMVLAHAVTILEVYLEDIVKSLIISNDSHLANTIKNVKPFCDTSFKLSEISIEKDGIKKFVIGKLSDSLYHDIPKVIKILSGIIGRKIDISIKDVCRVTIIRHDIVHRNGKGKDGNHIEITLPFVLDALTSIESFARDLRANIATLQSAQ
ncbi:hypothetical protein [Franzmannia qiaohouensis]|uniref:RiboL-PSP-HEPN domain-containing protein n=1 Tax=Franzmannia qiaohouensis TaxID=1329370 RepID=A0ABU1HLG7_9GAMM|nr:hypothetical protein [Halomonas qiaohouensis]MDR5907589.1 hypothetical protein [Halomonas qiaohouensis]